MSTRAQAEKAYEKARKEALDNAMAVCDELSMKSPLPLPAYRLFASSSIAGLVSAQVPSKPELAGLSASELSLALDQLFERELVAWHTNKGVIATRQPRNPETKRLLGGEVFMSEQALVDYGDDLYRIYFIANDFDHGEVRHTTLHAPQWRASMATQVSPTPTIVAPGSARKMRRVR